MSRKADMALRQKDGYDGEEAPFQRAVSKGIDDD
jgi:hypothetical protein